MCCPACQPGLSRYQTLAGIETDYIVVELVRLNYGEQWIDDFLLRMSHGGPEKILL